ncbi:hypothetical protein V1478_015951 [Vespula squamosa]|uniref:Uncharacterized protein n=1 Tax=Vespula squamosa TaxID=30214 RepID=A0ABD2A2A1_VESSQ
MEDRNSDRIDRTTFLDVRVVGQEHRTKRNLNHCFVPFRYKPTWNICVRRRNLDEGRMKTKTMEIVPLDEYSLRGMICEKSRMQLSPDYWHAKSHGAVDTV